jgi:signal transduction histidine kinase
MLADGDSGPLTPEQSHVVGIIDRNGHRLLALVEDLLTLARVESKGLEIDPAPLSVPALIANTRDSIKPSVAGRSQTLVVDVDPAVGEIVADGSMIDRALGNLLSNAIKFTPEGGTIRLAVAKRAGEVVFTVSDTGMGIGPEDRDRLFTRFFRSSEATINAIPGTGLGLSIVKQIVDAHGGLITVESELGKGTSVSFTVPGGGPSGRPAS